MSPLTDFLQKYHTITVTQEITFTLSIKHTYRIMERKKLKWVHHNLQVISTINSSYYSTGYSINYYLSRNSIMGNIIYNNGTCICA
jgi:hypothetical protein